MILYVIDALRPDHLEPYGYPRPTSPRISEFARDAVVFEQSYSQTSWTRASVACMLTGLHASTHHVQDELDPLPAAIPTVASMLKSLGFRTHGVTANPNLSAAFNFGRDFDEYVQLNDLKPLSPAVFAAINKSNPAKDRFRHPFFLYVHAMDPHTPYMVSEGSFGSLPGCAATETIFRQKEMRSGSGAECVVRLYDREVYRSDFYFGRLLDLLKTNGAYNDSLIVVTSDHGEAFFEHGTSGHGRTLYQNEIRVPLIMKLPAGQFAGARITAPARHIDILPTILDSVGATIPEEIEGKSLFGLIGGRGEARVVSELLLHGKRKRALVLDSYKILSDYQGDARQRARYELYDLSKDPREQEDIADRRPVLRDYMARLLNDWIRGQKTRAEKYRRGGPVPLDKETTQKLKALGYLQ